MKNKVVLENINEGKVYYLHQSLVGLDLYERTKTIERFIKHETKIMESCIENELRAIFQRNGIIILDYGENALKYSFDLLKAKGKHIVIVDRYKNLENEVILGVSPNHMTVIQEDDYTIGCAIEIREENLC